MESRADPVIWPENQSSFPFHNCVTTRWDSKTLNGGRHSNSKAELSSGIASLHSDAAYIYGSSTSPHIVLDIWSSSNVSQVAVSRFRPCLPRPEAHVHNINNGHHDENNGSTSFDSLQAIVGLLVRRGHENIDPCLMENSRSRKLDIHRA